MGVRRLEALRKFPLNSFGFSVLDVSSSFQVTFDFVGKGHQSKRHSKPGHRQPESAASGTAFRLQAWHNHRRSASPPDPPESKETSGFGYTHNIDSNRIFTGVLALS